MLPAVGAWVVAGGCALSAFSEPLKLIEQPFTIPERGTVIGCLVSVGTNHFSFLPPPLWRTSHKPGAAAVAIISSDLSSSVTIEFIARQPDDPAPSAATLLKERFGNSDSNEGVEFQTGLGAARAYDLHRKAPSGVRVSSRVCYVSTPTATVEFALTAPAAKFDEHNTIFANVVNSFRVAGQ